MKKDAVLKELLPTMDKELLLEMVMLAIARKTRRLLEEKYQLMAAKRSVSRMRQ